MAYVPLSPSDWLASKENLVQEICNLSQLIPFDRDSLQWCLTFWSYPPPPLSSLVRDERRKAATNTNTALKITWSTAASNQPIAGTCRRSNLSRPFTVPHTRVRHGREYTSALHTHWRPSSRYIASIVGVYLAHWFPGKQFHIRDSSELPSALKPLPVLT